MRPVCLAWCTCALWLTAGCAGVLRDPYPGSFRYSVLNGAREDLYDRAIPQRTPSAFEEVSVSRSSIPAEVPPLPPRSTVAPRYEVPPLPPAGRRRSRARKRRLQRLTRRSRAEVPPLPPTHPRGQATPALARWLRHGDSAEVRRQRLAEFAASLVGMKRIVVQGRRYPANCSDFVRAVYSIEGIDLYKWPGRKHGGGVRSLYALAKASGGLHFRRRPLPGDLVYFHHTYDFNRNRRVDDFLSHIGIVEKVTANGTVHYIDRSSGRIRRGQLNLKRPWLWRDPHSLTRLNSYLRKKRRSDPPGTRYLAGDLFAGFATLIR